ncbi:hypothetical protein ACIHCQ_42185 [Streptomyces sp. NPDC052236]|uniref:hypothetical protein n=1 Tax=Streptomyces sp. NPDC052236 TaxID=3365686 RepID=UPI0037CE9A8C
METGKPPAGSGHRRPETTTDLVLKLPAPPEHPIASTPVLITEEEDVFVRCEVAIENLKVAFWAAGKALEIIRQGRLYRAEYTSFDDYCDQRWGMSRGQADKLIRMWRIAQAMFESMPFDSNDPTRIRVKKLNQAVVWELVPVAEGYDIETATAVYRTTVEADDGPVTAEVVRSVVRSVVKTLSKGEGVDQDALARAVHAALQQAVPRKPTASTKRTDAKQKAAPADSTPTLPWDSPEALDRLLRQHMAAEDRITLGKMLMEG